MDLHLTRYGPSAVLVKFADVLDPDCLARCRGLLRWLDTHPREALKDCTPAGGALLLEFSDAVSERRLSDLSVAMQGAVPLPADEATLHEVPVTYDGPDLQEYAERQKLSVAEVVARHAAPIYSVDMIGFSPGFPYLGPLDERLHLPRRPSPRLRVPAGSVGIGGEHTGIYSIASPGGWWLIGRTSTKVFLPEKARDAGRADAFLFRPGDRVRIEPAVP